MARGIVRIIGGKWRGRKLKVPTASPVRPTPDRVRETLFNWLAPVLPGATCLDAFAGSGILGFEAASRGAAHIVMTDNSSRIIQLLQAECVLFKATQIEIYQAKVPGQLKQPAKPFDIVFLDPPYDDNVLRLTCFYLEEQHFLASPAYIYLESRDPLSHALLPANWKMVKSKHAGQVKYHLAYRSIA